MIAIIITLSVIIGWAICAGIIIVIECNAGIDISIKKHFKDLVCFVCGHKIIIDPGSINSR